MSPEKSAEILRRHPKGSPDVRYSSQGVPSIRLESKGALSDPLFMEMMQASLRWHAEHAAAIQAARKECD